MRTGRQVVVAAVVGLMAAIAAAGEGHFRYERAVVPAASGPNRLDIDVPLLIGGKPLRYSASRRDSGPYLTFAGGLEDLRLYDPAGREVGYLLIGPPEPTEQWRKGDVLPIVSTEEESGFEVDLGGVLRINSVRVSGIPAPFLKRVRLEGSGDRVHWSVLVAAGTLFDLPADTLRRIDFDFAAGEFQYLRVTWDDRNSAPVPLPSSVSARVVATPVSVLPTVVPIGFTRVAGEPGESRFRLHLPGPDLPITAIELTCGEGPLLRPAYIKEPEPAGTESGPVVLGRTILRRTVHGDLSAADLRIPIDRPHERDIGLVVEDGDNPRLDLLAVSAELAPLPWIYFESAAGESLTARFGDPELPAARYDLEAMRGALANLQFAQARWGETRDLGPAASEPEPAGSPLPPSGAPIDASSFQYARKLPEGSAGLVTLLLDAAVLAHSRSMRDLRIADSNGTQVPYVLEKLDQPISIDLPDLQVLPPRSGQTRSGETRYRVLLPYDRLPEARLVLSTTARVFSRQVMVAVEQPPADARAEPRLVMMMSAPWAHTTPETLAPPLVLRLLPIADGPLELIVNEGDNSALPITHPKLLLPAYRMRFFRPDFEELTLLYGQPTLEPPRYDLALMATRMRGMTATEISAGPEIAGPRAQVKHGTDLQTKVFWAALVVVVAILLLLVARLVSRGEDSPESK